MPPVPGHGSRDETGSHGVKSVATAFEIIEALVDLDNEGRVTTIADETGISKSSVHKHLSSLQELGYVAKDDGATYRLSFQFLDVGNRIRDSFIASSYVKQKVSDLANRTNEIGFFTVEEQNMARILFRESGQQGVPTRSYAGKQIPIHQVAAGKAILSEYPEERVREIVDEVGLPKATEQTITDETELLADLERTRERGYALSVEEATEGLMAVSVPITISQGEVVGGCAIGGPVHRLDGEKGREEIPDLLRSVANEMELSLAHSRSN